MRAIRGRDTMSERELRSKLHAAGLRFRKHSRPLPALRCSADVVFRSERVAVFLDGCFWHGCPEHWSLASRNSDFWRQKVELTQERDRRNDSVLSAAGWCVIRIWEHEDVTHGAERVRDAVLMRRGPRKKS